MAQLFHIKAHIDSRGELFSLSDIDLGFPIKRSFYIIPKKNQVRGNHNHLANITAIICVQGECLVKTKWNGKEENLLLNKPSMCLRIEPEEWREMTALTENCLLIVFASEYYDQSDYQPQK